MDYTPIAGHYNRYEAKASTLWSLGYPAVLKQMDPLTEKKILDYGCRTGIFS